MSVGKELVDIIKKSESRETKAYDTTATVTRVEGSTIWVHIPGGVDETPVQKTINANPGDSVQVRVSGGSAWLVGNATAPPTDDGQAIIAQKIARTATKVAENAQMIAGNTNQYFWHTESGNDTGAHITEIPKADFIADPANGGGNLLARSNGVTVRDGLTELVTMSSSAFTGKGGDGAFWFDVSASSGSLATQKEFIPGKRISTSSWQTIDLSQYDEWAEITNGQSFTARVNFKYEGQSSMPGKWTTYTKGTAQTATYSKYDGLNTLSYKGYPNSIDTYLHVVAPYEYTYISISYTKTDIAPAYLFGATDSSSAGGYSVNLGYGNTVSGNYAYAEGKDNTSSDVCSHAEGWQTQASGGYSHAEGNHTYAYGQGAHAEGYYTEASNPHTHAEGDHCVADGWNSHAQNENTKAMSRSQTALGKFNVADSADTYAVIVGNGTADNARSNALTVAWNGNTAIAGTLTQGSDRRLKDHVSYLDEDAIEFVRQLKPAHYIKDGADHVGFYAQDVESVDTWNCMIGEMNGYKTLGYTELIAPLVAYCQHLEKRIEELEDKK